ncbi:MAG: alpha/beta fold hydrolase [Planctomycetota bacterium]|nr:alpha/beta fold hydrolase [Planctomycetota bacterium]
MTPARSTLAKKRWWLLGYLLLLAASSLYQVAHEDPARPGDSDLVAVELRPELPTGGRLEGSEHGVRVMHLDLGAGDGTPVLLLHGSPASGTELRALGEALATAPGGQTRRVIVPQLPGFGDSERDVPDYSARAEAGYCLQLLDQLGIERVHVVGHSMGAAVALCMVERDALRVESLSLVAGLGVVELELFGTHLLNHLVHGAQLNLLRLAHHGLPHFGALDDSLLSVEYARSFYDTDQRPLREVLETWAGPSLILHGQGDFLVPPAAAKEHARLLPQAELLLLESDHFLVFTDPTGTADYLGRFLERVEAGQAPTRGQALAADPSLLATSTAPFDPSSIPPATGPALLLLMLLFAVGTLVSEDLACIAAGMLVAQGRVEFWPAALACFLGIYIGDMLLYLAGRFFGAAAINRAPINWVLSEKSVTRASAWFDKNGARAVFLSRLMPGLRLPTYFAAGVLRAGFWRFTLLFFLASLLWTPLLVGFAAWLATHVTDSMAWFEEYSLLAFLALLAAVLLVERVLIPLCTWRGRRLFVGRVRRWTRWEFWPRWLFYPPVILHIARLALRHRSLALVGAVNPGIPGGGFVGESKAQILSAFGPTSEAIADWILLEPTSAKSEQPAGRRSDLQDRGTTAEAASSTLDPGDAGVPRSNRERARAFVAEHGLPVAFKPDVGERGAGVRILRTEAELDDALARLDRPCHLQRFAPGPEYGVFVVRRPKADGSAGPIELYSITAKRPYAVTGDGSSSLERLILADRRAVVQAKQHFETHAERLQEVPAAGEEVVLCDLGTHSLGALFLDANDEGTEELRAALAQVCEPFRGLHFGRFDLRVAPPHELGSGRGIAVIELNGMTAEAAHIYDPRHGVGYAWRTLCDQWTLAFEIAAANHARGASYPSLGTQLRALFR